MTRLDTSPAPLVASTSADSAGSRRPRIDGRKVTLMTHSECNYTIAPLSDSEAELCRKPAIRRAILPTDDQKEMFYCFQHWNQVKTFPLIEQAAIEDLVEEEC
jgi:hypothetical protein